MVGDWTAWKYFSIFRVRFFPVNWLHCLSCLNLIFMHNTPRDEYGRERERGQHQELKIVDASAQGLSVENWNVWWKERNHFICKRWQDGIGLLYSPGLMSVTANNNDSSNNYYYYYNNISSGTNHEFHRTSLYFSKIGGKFPKIEWCYSLQQDSELISRVRCY